jgi:hypothetical protein
VSLVDERQADDAEILSQIIGSMRRLDPAALRRVYQTIGTFFELEPTAPVVTSKPLTSEPAERRPRASSPATFSEDRSLSPKQFLNEKRPRTDVERVACLAFYLTHYRSTPEFTTLDISKINTEAAQRKLANPTAAVNNAAQYGYLVPASKGNRQISAPGERYVQLLPDYDAAKEAMASARPRWAQKKRSKSKIETSS